MLVMNQEQERKQLLCLLRGVSMEDLQDPDCDSMMKEGKILSPFFAGCPNLLFLSMVSFLIPLSHTDCQEQAALRNSCVKKLRNIYTDSQRHIQTPAVPHLHVQAQATTEIRPEHQLDECCLVLLIQLSELQEAEDWEVLSALEASYVREEVG